MTESNPFAILGDPLDIARAERATEIAWSYVEAGIPSPERDRQRMRMVYVVVSLAIERADEPTDLAHRAIRRFQERQLRR
ncbi:MAG: hypothetical protein J0I42_15150 [Bosea sp.]|uniref:hypothetical protein n=1 Tax=Bosea sp. (in: a-proteobacteria) TaxID=1871050 RepID=UPI001ACEBEF0|nr:hypothetical protein [Bosea sp. (in: a-proteobacteria)]MBN9453284.1 hypothetical protein [Bosea sp. (in: a-proteobacteria)]